MIKFETMVGEISLGMEMAQSSNNAFLSITDKKHATKVHQILGHGFCYGYIKVLVDEEEPFEHYYLQIVPIQWLYYIEMFERFVTTGYVQAEVPSILELKRIDEDTLSFKIKESLFVFSYLEFIKQFIHAAFEYFTVHQQMTNDDLYEDIIVHLKQLQTKFYIAD